MSEKNITFSSHIGEATLKEVYKRNVTHYNNIV